MVGREGELSHLFVKDYEIAKEKDKQFCIFHFFAIFPVSRHYS